MKKTIYILCALMLIVSCSDTTNDGNPNGNGNGQDLPTGVNLVFPHQDDLCNEGTNITETESTVFFEWEPNSNAETYTLTLENLSSGNTTQYETSDFILPVTIQRAVAYRWFVEYNHQDEAKVSAIWNFYNAGPGVVTYPPFPADLIAPMMAQNIPSTTSVILHWEGSDVENDIVGYDVYVSTNNSPELNTSDITANQLTVTVAPDNIYYWKVVTKDADGNTSESNIFQFRILE